MITNHSYKALWIQLSGGQIHVLKKTTSFSIHNLYFTISQGCCSGPSRSSIWDSLLTGPRWAKKFVPGPVKFCERLAVGLHVRAAPLQHPSRNTSTDTIKQQLPCWFLQFSLTASSVLDLTCPFHPTKESQNKRNSC